MFNVYIIEQQVNYSLIYAVLGIFKIVHIE